MKKIFITSTGTEVGKTIIINSLIKKLKALDKVIKARKPVISGFQFEDTPNDISLICESMGMEYTHINTNDISYYQFIHPLSPDQAARMEGREIKFDKLLEFCSPKGKYDYLLIEGIGGLHVPLGEGYTVMDLIKQTDADINILVAGSYLGSLSHTISAIKNFQSMGIKLHIVIVTENMSPDSDYYIPSGETVKSLKDYYDGKILEIKHKKGSFADITKQIAGELDYEF